MLAIYKKELKACFHSMIGYMFIAFLVAFTGMYFMAYNLNYGYPYFGYVLSGISFVLIIVVPILTMRSFAEERKNKTDQLLLTSPVSLTGIVLGKYLSMVTVFGAPCVIFLIFPLIIKSQGIAYVGIDYLSIFMFFLLGCVFIAIGMFISTLTESQILAAIGSFGALLVLYLWEGIVGFLPDSKIPNTIGVVLLLAGVVFLIYEMTNNWVVCTGLQFIGTMAIAIIYVIKSDVFEGLLSTVFGKLNLFEPLNNVINNHLFDTTGVVMYVSLILLFVFLATEMMQKRRWS